MLDPANPSNKLRQSQDHLDSQPYFQPWGIIEITQHQRAQIVAIAVSYPIAEVLMAMKPLKAAFSAVNPDVVTMCAIVYVLARPSGLTKLGTKSVGFASHPDRIFNLTGRTIFIIMFRRSTTGAGESLI